MSVWSAIAVTTVDSCNMMILADIIAARETPYHRVLNNIRAPTRGMSA
jgi:hypothetical protein